MRNVYIASAFRSAVTPRGGSLASLEPYELAAPVIKHCLDTINVNPHQVNEIIVGNALGAGGNPARTVALAAKLPSKVAGMSIDRQCCSGLDALLVASALIESGKADVVIAGGVESYSRRPTRYSNPINGEAKPYDEAPFIPWSSNPPSMAEAADQVAQNLGICKQSQDAWAIESHRKARHNQRFLSQEIVAINGAQHDAYTRNLSEAVCQRAKNLSGSISAANTAVAADAAAFCILVSESIANKLQQRCVRLIHGLTIGSDPSLPAMACIDAVNSLCQQTGVNTNQLNNIEIMEAYAAQTIACVQQCQLEPSLVNRRGGAIARGHPIGASGAILAVRLFHEATLTRGYGLATIAAAGGIATAMLTTSE